MSSVSRRKLLIIWFDLLIALSAFWLARYFGDMPRWYWLVLSAVIWVVLGGASRKLQFGAYKRIRYAFLGIFALDILSGLFLYTLYRHCVPGYEYDYSIILATGIIMVLEWALYCAVRRLVYRKIPFFYEEPLLDDVTEVGINTGIEHTELLENRDVTLLLNLTRKAENSMELLRRIQESLERFSPATTVMDSPEPESVLAHKVRLPRLVIHRCPLNRVRHINTLFSYTNYCMERGGLIACHCTTAGIRREKIMRQNPVIINHILFFLDYCWHRIIPKLSFTRDFYFGLTKGRNRVLTRVEILGRLYRAGFDVLHEEVVHGEFYVIAAKVKEPVRDDKPSGGLLIRLKRKGKDGKIIGVYKFRTMYAYSEYLQPYIYKQAGLCSGGKIADDYRVNAAGRFLRKTWLGELPMLINWIKGDLKLVGVRPLSNHYFSLYSEKLRALRIQTKPGLIPPFYADMPGTLDEIQESERRYLEQYLRSPFLTDWRYFWKAFRNIVFRGKRSR